MASGAALAQDRPIPVFQAFGLVGDFAGDCSRPPVRGNQHSFYRVAAGEMTLTYDHGPGVVPTRYTILSARQLDPDRISYVQQNRDDQRMLEIEVVKTQGGVRVWYSRRTSGEVLVRNGNFNDGTPSPLQVRCGD